MGPDQVENENKSPQLIGSVETTLSILDALDNPSELSLTEIENRLDISASTIYKHLSTLSQHGYVIKEGGMYRRSLRFLDIGENVRFNHFDLYKASQDAAQKLADETNELVWVMVEENGYGYYIYKSRGEESIDAGIHPEGTRNHLHYSASGKAILAHLPDDLVNEILDRGLASLSENTITDRERLMSELEEIRKTDVSYNKGESMPGIFAIGSPILDDERRVYGAISVSGPRSRIVGKKRQDLADDVIQTANIIEIELSDKKSSSVFS